MSPVEFNSLPFTERPDLTPYLIHLTRSTKDDDDFSAFDNLVNIIETGSVWATQTYIKGRCKAACFMDVPFIALKYICNKGNKERYQPYGVFVTKKYAYNQGARPVLYLSDKEIRRLKLPADEQWRAVKFEVTQAGWISWLHEREWRCPGDFQLPKNPFGVLVRAAKEAVQFQKMLLEERRELSSVPRSILPLEIICQGLNYL